MKANELRIGNLVYFYRDIKEIEGISIRLRPDVGYFELSGINTPQKGIHLKPIPLTEEWLVMFGFIKTNSTYDNGLLSISLPSEDKLLWKNGRTYFNSWKILDAPQYVHQLQNLYFALTGQELVIKNK